MPAHSPTPTFVSTLRRLGLLAALAAGTASLPAAIYYWDANGGTAGTGGTGTWNGSSALFRAGSTGGALQAWPNTDPSGDEVVFGGTAGTVTVASSYTVSVNRLTFSSNYTLNRGNPNSRINFSGTAPTITVNSGITVTNNVTLGGTAVTLTGGGTFQLGASDRIDNTLGVAITGGTTLALGANNETVGTVTLTDGTISGTGILTSTSAFNVESGTINAVLAGTGIGLTKTGAGTVTLGGANTYTGDTVINAGTIAIGATGRIANTANLTINGGSLAMGGFTEWVNVFTLNSGSVTGGGNFGANTFNVHSGTLATALTNPAGTGSLNKLSAGTVTLSGANTYTGATAIQAGTLLLTGSLGNTATTVSSGATFAGSGTSAGTVVVNGTLAPAGASGPIGTLSTGAETWNGGGRFSIDLNNATGAAGTGWDRLNLSGALTIAATSGSPFTLDLNGLNAGGSLGIVANFNQASSYAWTIANATSIAGFAANKFTIDASDFALNNAFTGTFSVAASATALSLVYTPIPEPRVYALLLGLGTLGLVVVRRWRRNEPVHG